MKRTQKSYAVNNQEDEDGYTLDPANAIIHENGKGKQTINSNNITVNNEAGAEDQPSERFVHSPSEMLNETTEK